MEQKDKKKLSVDEIIKIMVDSNQIGDISEFDNFKSDEEFHNYVQMKIVEYKLENFNLTPPVRNPEETKKWMEENKQKLIEWIRIKLIYDRREKKGLKFHKNLNN